MSKFHHFVSLSAAIAALIVALAATSCTKGPTCTCTYSDSNGHHTITASNPDGKNCATDAYVEGHPDAVCK